MKKFTIPIILFLCASPALSAQTTVRFVPEDGEKGTGGQPFGRGKIEQTGHDFTQKIRIELPQKTLHLALTPGRLKQYRTVFTSEGEVPSRVELYEATDSLRKYYITAIDRRFYGLLTVENGTIISVEKSGDALYTYQKNTPDEMVGYSCTHDHGRPPNSFSAARSQAALLSGCYEFPIGFVSDYAHYRFLGENISEVEADNLLKLAAAQEIWAPHVFNANISFSVIGQVIQTNEANPPWTTDSRKALGRVWGDLHNVWSKPSEWKKYKSLTLAGITGINFGSTPDELNTWGYGGGGQNEFGMGTVILKDFLTGAQLRWLFAHELGHVFGAGHDNSSGYVMFSQYGAATWSPQSKDAINATLTKLDTKNWLRECPRLAVIYALKQDSIGLEWQTNYDSVNDSFMIETSTDDGKTWAKVTEIKSKGVFTYKVTLPYTLPLGNGSYFRVRQQGENSLMSNIINVSITAIINAPSADDITVYPNPFMHQLTVKSSMPRSLAIFDLTGREILRLSTPKTHHIIDTFLWNFGTYFIRFDDHSSKVYKVTK